MNLATTYERQARTAPARCFSGGWDGHGKIEPLPIERTRRPLLAWFMGRGR